MVKISLVLFLTISIYSGSFGQTDWESRFNGYVVTDDNQVIKGYLKYDGSHVDRGTRIMLYKKPNETPQIFYSLELKGYAIKKDTFRILHNLQPFIDDKKFFTRAEAKLEQRGKLTLLSIQEEIPQYSMSGYTGTPTGLSTSTQRMPGGNQKIITYLVLNDKGEIVGIKKENFKDVMHELIPDAPMLLDKIDRRILKYKDLVKIIKEYNETSRPSLKAP